MPRLEITVSKDYVKSWGAPEGLRELVTNAIDAAREAGGEATVVEKGGKLRIQNTGSTLPRKALVLGEHGGVDSVTRIGTHGEGLKVGALALCRAGIPVTIRTGREVWRAAIEPSETFGVDLLTFRIERSESALYDNAVQVEIPCSEGLWDGCRWKFLYFSPPPEGQAIKTDRGSLLVGDAYKGKLFVKGVYVQTDSSLPYGYDFARVELDRDRRVLGKYDIQYEAAQIWAQALATRPELGKVLLQQLAAGGDELGVEDYTADRFPENFRKEAAADFRATYGETAVPVENLAESRDLEHLGVRGVVLPKSLRHLVASEVGSAAAAQARLKDDVTATHSWADLAKAEQAALLDAVDLANVGLPGERQVNLTRVEVVTFRRPDLLGLYLSADGRIQVARGELASTQRALRVLVHEASHAAGGDGDKGHVAAMEEAWARIVGFLWGAK